jgi:hypothetical protein
MNVPRELQDAQQGQKSIGLVHAASRSAVCAGADSDKKSRDHESDELVHAAVSLLACLFPFNVFSQNVTTYTGICSSRLRGWLLSTALGGEMLQPGRRS